MIPVSTQNWSVKPLSQNSCMNGLGSMHKIINFIVYPVYIHLYTIKVQRQLRKSTNSLKGHCIADCKKVQGAALVQMNGDLLTPRG